MLPGGTLLIEQLVPVCAMDQKLLLNTLTRLRSVRTALDAEIAALEQEIGTSNAGPSRQHLRASADAPLSEGAEDWSDRNDAPEVPARRARTVRQSRPTPERKDPLESGDAPVPNPSQDWSDRSNAPEVPARAAGAEGPVKLTRQAAVRQNIRERFDPPLETGAEDWSDRSNTPEAPARLAGMVRLSRAAAEKMVDAYQRSAIEDGIADFDSEGAVDPRSLDPRSMSDQDLAHFIVLHDLADTEVVEIDNEADERDDDESDFAPRQPRARRPAPGG